MPEIRWEIDHRAFWQAAIDADLGATMNQFAKSLGVSPSTLSRLLAGKTQPSADLLAKLRLAFGPAAFEQIAHAIQVEVCA